MYLWSGVSESGAIGRTSAFEFSASARTSAFEFSAIGRTSAFDAIVGVFARACAYVRVCAYAYACTRAITLRRSHRRHPNPLRRLLHPYPRAFLHILARIQDPSTRRP